MPGHRPAAAALVLAVVMAVPATSHAQFGALRRAVERKAGEQVDQRVDDKANLALLQEPTFDGTTVELTDALLDRYIAGLERIKATRAQRRAESDRLMASYEAQRDSAQALADANRADRARFDARNATFDECRTRFEGEREELLEAAMEKIGERLQRRMQANPTGTGGDAAIQRLAQAAQRFSEALATGDSVAVRKAQLDMLAGEGMLTPAEKAKLSRTLAAACGAPTPKPTWMVQQEALEGRAQATRERHRLAGLAAGKPSGADLGLTDVQAAMVDERIQSWRGGMRRDAPLTTRFTRQEYDRLVSRRSAIERAMRG